MPYEPGNAGRLDLEISSDAAFFPITEANRVWPITAANLFNCSIGAGLLTLAALFGLSQRALGFRRKRPLWR